jgi:four helix bundle protein
VKLNQHLCTEKNEYVLSKQLLRSGTAIGALIREAEFGQSRADFRSKMSIALKEANETDYWLNLLKDTNYINEKVFWSHQ